jgi:hypothetical protein
MYGSLVHRDVAALNLEIDVAKKTIKYTAFFDDAMMEKIRRFNEWQHSDSIITLWRLKRLIKKEGNLNFELIVQKFVRDFCGPSWVTTLTVDNVSNYVDSDEQRTGEDLQSN